MHIVINNTKRLLNLVNPGAKNVSLIPGTNSLQNLDVLSHPSNQRLIDAGWITPPKDWNKGAKQALSFGDLSRQDAIDAVGKTYDAEVLTGMLEQTKDTQVKGAIKKRLADLEEAAKQSNPQE